VGYVDSNYCDDVDLTRPYIFNVGSSLANMATIYGLGNAASFGDISTTITDDSVFAIQLDSNDTTLTDLSSETNNGSNVGSVAADGSELGV
jgi:hypothetical protein